MAARPVSTIRQDVRTRENNRKDLTATTHMRPALRAGRFAFRPAKGGPAPPIRSANFPPDSPTPPAPHGTRPLPPPPRQPAPPPARKPTTQYSRGIYNSGA